MSNSKNQLNGYLKVNRNILVKDILINNENAPFVYRSLDGAQVDLVIPCIIITCPNIFGVDVKKENIEDMLSKTENIVGTVYAAIEDTKLTKFRLECCSSSFTIYEMLIRPEHENEMRIHNIISYHTIKQKICDVYNSIINIINQTGLNHTHGTNSVNFKHFGVEDFEDLVFDKILEKSTNDAESKNITIVQWFNTACISNNNDGKKTKTLINLLCDITKCQSLDVPHSNRLVVPIIVNIERRTGSTASVLDDLNLMIDSSDIHIIAAEDDIAYKIVNQYKWAIKDRLYEALAPIVLRELSIDVLFDKLYLINSDHQQSPV